MLQIMAMHSGELAQPPIYWKHLKRLGNPIETKSQHVHFLANYTNEAQDYCTDIFLLPFIYTCLLN